MLAQKLLASPQNMDNEYRTLELLKLRFGEASLNGKCNFHLADPFSIVPGDLTECCFWCFLISADCAVCAVHRVRRVR